MRATPGTRVHACLWTRAHGAQHATATLDARRTAVRGGAARRAAGKALHLGATPRRRSGGPPVLAWRGGRWRHAQWSVRRSVATRSHLHDVVRTDGVRGGKARQEDEGQEEEVVEEASRRDEARAAQSTTTHLHVNYYI